MDAAVEHRLRPGQEAVVELVEVADADGLGLDQEALSDDPVQPLLLAPALGLSGQSGAG
jgi:hypothetical protein